MPAEREPPEMFVDFWNATETEPVSRPRPVVWSEARIVAGDASVLFFRPGPNWRAIIPVRIWRRGSQTNRAWAFKHAVRLVYRALALSSVAAFNGHPRAMEVDV